MRLLVFAAFAVAAFFGCQEKKSSSNQTAVSQPAASASTPAAAETTTETATGFQPGQQTVTVGELKVSQPVDAERQNIQDQQNGTLKNQPGGGPDPNAHLQKTVDESGKEVYFRKQAAPTAAPSATELQSKKVNVPISSIGAPTASRVAFFTSQNFYFAMAARSSEPNIFEKNYKEKWLVFKSDQTLEVYKKGTLVEKGKWAFRESDNNLFLSCDDPYINNSWKFQTMPGAVLFVGNTDLNKTGIQARLFMSDEKPH